MKHMKFDEFINEWTSLPKTELREDVLYVVVKINDAVSKIKGCSLSSLQRYVSTGTEFYVTLWHKDKTIRDLAVNALQNIFPVVGQTSALGRDIHKDTEKKVHFRIVNMDSESTQIIFTRNKPTR